MTNIPVVCHSCGCDLNPSEGWVEFHTQKNQRIVPCWCQAPTEWKKSLDQTLVILRTTCDFHDGLKSSSTWFALRDCILHKVSGVEQCLKKEHEISGWTGNGCVQPWSCLFSNQPVVLLACLLQDAVWNNICGWFCHVCSNESHDGSLDG